jgi:hypothetical protein
MFAAVLTVGCQGAVLVVTSIGGAVCLATVWVTACQPGMCLYNLVVAADAVCVCTTWLLLLMQCG